MFSKYWLVIRDDTKRTYEVCGKVSNENTFTNKTYGMQQAGMNVSSMTPPVTGKVAFKDAIKISGYTQEDGLWARLEKEYMRIRMQYPDDHED
jgi:hypothetical protein